MSSGFRTQSLEVVSSIKMQVSHKDVEVQKTFLGSSRFIRLIHWVSYFIYFILDDSKRISNN